jgi:hypothetical protein
MNRELNPYPATIIDETSGISVPNLAYRIWLEGYQAGRESTSFDESKGETAS